MRGGIETSDEQMGGDAPVRLPVRRKLYEDVAESLKEMIAKGDLAPGQRIPSESELVSLLKVGRSTLREAVRLLESMNVLELRPGVGTFVCLEPGRPDDPLGFYFASDTPTVASLFEARRIIEPSVAALAAKRADGRDLQSLEEAVVEMAQVVDKGEAHLQVDRAFHEAVARAAKNPVLSRILPIIHDALVEGYRVTASSTESAHRASLAHRRIFEAIHRRDEATAAREMLAHLDEAATEIWGSRSGAAAAAESRRPDGREVGDDIAHACVHLKPRP